MSMGLVCDRDQEHLGTSDAGILRVRTRILHALQQYRDEGGPPPGVDDPSVYQVRSTLAFLPKEVDWLEAMEELRRVVPGTNPGGSAVGVPSFVAGRSPNSE
jgi:phthalate 4,5-dioxygenase